MRKAFFLILTLIVLLTGGCKPEQKETFEKKTASATISKSGTKIKNMDVCEEAFKTKNIDKNKLLNTPPSKRKKLFISLITPAALRANCIIEKEREKFLKIKKKIEEEKPLKEKEKYFLKKLKKVYETDNLNELYYRVNILPPSIVIAQAAIESGWGTSRFFLEGNNLFGIWTFSNSTAHIKAKNSAARVKKYPSSLYSIEDYYHNINTGWAYKELRKERLKTKDPLILANYLKNYSILREEYVRRIKRVITKNNLQRFDKCSFNNCSIDL